ncbi:MAG TPA: hypothetical protein VK821_17260, partial [Dehalococcoidia bacterium]|nr:hypothetical protein [Dehalococcoidia bacterium]
MSLPSAMREDVPARAVGVLLVRPPRHLRSLFLTRAETLIVVGSVVAAMVIRAHYLFAGNFPLNDGGLFYLMTRELQEAHFRLPLTTAYNHAQIPFAYPPLGFYAAAVVASLFHVDLLQVFRFLPAAINVTCVIAFYGLARRLLDSPLQAALATAVFAIAPRSFIWYIMGGGLTRSFGLLFALLALRSLHDMYRNGRYRDVSAAALFCTLTLLSHIETAYFLAFSAVMFFLWIGRSRRGVIESAIVGLATILLSAPWWLTVMLGHGVSPFVSAAQTSGSLLEGVLLLTLASFTGEPLFPVLTALALLGLLICWRRSRLFLVYWLLAMFLLDARAAPNFATIPLSLLAA